MNYRLESHEIDKEYLRMVLGEIMAPIKMPENPYHQMKDLKFCAGLMAATLLVTSTPYIPDKMTDVPYNMSLIKMLEFIIRTHGKKIKTNFTDEHFKHNPRFN